MDGNPATPGETEPRRSEGGATPKRRAPASRSVPPAAPASAPRYMQLAHTLQEAIRRGDYPVGSLLPTEIELSTRYAVSRHTVRQAIGVLRQQNLVLARKGIGTRVESRGAPRTFSYSASSVSDLLEVVRDSELVIESQVMMTARGSITTTLGCRSGRRFLHLSCTRLVDGEEKPLSSIEAYIDGSLAPLVKLPPILRQALFVTIEKQTGQILTEIEQEIRATLVPEAVAGRLQAKAGMPALEITRRFYSTGRRLVMVAILTMPSDRSFYSVSINRD